MEIPAKKLAILDLDGVIANGTERFNRAAQLYPDRSGDAYWRAALDPDFVSLDTPIPGAIAATMSLRDAGYTILILTSRPQEMFEASRQWLEDNGLDMQLTCKAEEDRYTRTPVWKAHKVRDLATGHLAWDEIVVVDDEADHLNHIRRTLADLRMPSYRLCQRLVDIATTRPEGAKYQAALMELGQLRSYNWQLEQTISAIACYLHDNNRWLGMEGSDFSGHMVLMGLQEIAKAKGLADWHQLDQRAKEAEKARALPKEEDDADIPF